MPPTCKTCYPKKQHSLRKMDNDSHTTPEKAKLTRKELKERSCGWYP
jgi:hypothetical protein